MDLILILDESNSVSYEDFKRQIKLALQIAESLDISLSGSHFGIISSGNRAVVHADLNTQGKSKKEVKYQLAKMPLAYYPLQYSRRSEALNLALTMFRNAPSMRTAPKVLVVIVDGPITGSSRLLLTPSQNLKNMGVSVFTIPIGNNGDQNQADIISSSTSHSVKAESFSKLSQMSDELTMNVICPGR